MTFITLNIGNLLEATKDMYAEIETRVTEDEVNKGIPVSEDMQNDLDKWLAIIQKYDPMFLVSLDDVDSGAISEH